MSSDKSLVGGEVIDHDESIGKELDVINRELDAIHSDLTSTALSHEDGEEIIAAALEGASDQSAVRITVYENIPFAGGDGDYSILSVLFGAHSIGEGIFGYLNMIDSNKVRVQCVECRDAVMDFPWMDVKSKIKGSVKAWRAAFPVARSVNVSHRRDIVDADFVHIRGDARVRLHTVHISNCLSVTDAAFEYLRGIHTLYMGMGIWERANISDAAFVHLRGIHTLIMNYCDQKTITDAAFVHLRGIHLLNMSYCDQITLSDKLMTLLIEIKELHVFRCDRDLRKAFAHEIGKDYESEPESAEEDDDEEEEAWEGVG